VSRSFQETGENRFDLKDQKGRARYLLMLALALKDLKDLKEGAPKGPKNRTYRT